MLVEGLLTYYVINAEKVVKKIGANEVLRAVTNVSKAELSRVFATVHMEQIAAAWQMDKKAPTTTEKSVLGPAEAPEGENRSLICSHVIEHITPLVEDWGVKVVSFQLESIKLADQGYAREYEEASLAIAKGKANLRAVVTQNDILLSTAEAKASAVKLEAEGRKSAMIIQAKGEAEMRMIAAEASSSATIVQAKAEAESRTIEAKARNSAAETMSNKFARDLSRDIALAQQQVEFARALKVNVLTVVPDSVIGRSVAQQPMITGRYNLQDGKQDQ